MKITQVEITKEEKEQLEEYIRTHKDGVSNFLIDASKLEDAKHILSIAKVVG